MRKLKCFWGNLDGMRNAIVIATSQAKACAVINQVSRCGLGHFRVYFQEQREVPEGFKPETLYTRDNQAFGLGSWEGWTEGRCELNRKR